MRLPGLLNQYTAEIFSSGLPDWVGNKGGRPVEGFELFPIVHIGCASLTIAGMVVIRSSASGVMNSSESGHYLLGRKSYNYLVR